MIDDKCENPGIIKLQKYNSLTSPFIIFQPFSAFLKAVCAYAVIHLKRHKCVMLASGFMSVCLALQGQEPMAILWPLWLHIHETAVKVSALVTVFLSSEKLPYRQDFMKVRHCAVIREVRHRVPVTSKDPLGGEQSLQAHWTAGVDTSCTDTNFCPFKRESVFRVFNMMENLTVTFFLNVA